MTCSLNRPVGMKIITMIKMAKEMKSLYRLVT